MSESHFAHLQEDAYLAVLRAFQATQCTSWSHQLLLRQLREKLEISQDKHIECLGRILNKQERSHPVPKEKSTTAHGERKGPTGGKEKVDRMRNAQRDRRNASHEPKRAPVAKELHSAVDRKRKFKKTHEDTVDETQLISKHKPSTKTGKSSSSSSNVRYLRITPELLHEFDESGLNHLYGRTLETFWEEKDADNGRWYSAIVSDYNKDRKEHKLTYDHGTADETFEWVSLDEEVQKGNIRVPDVDPPNSFHVGRSLRCGEPPFDDATFEKMLKEGTLEELQWMLAQTQRKIHAFCSDYKIPKNPSSQDEAVVKKIIRRSKLIVEERKKRKFS